MAQLCPKPGVRTTEKKPCKTEDNKERRRNPLSLVKEERERKRRIKSNQGARKCREKEETCALLGGYEPSKEVWAAQTSDLPWQRTAK